MMDALYGTTHMHITSWAVALILFFVTYAMQKGSKGRKITHMILRLFYILVILTGLFLFLGNHGINDMMYGVKLVLGIVTVGLMEMTLVKSNKGQKATVFLAATIVVFILTFLVGSYLPLGPLNFLA